MQPGVRLALSLQSLELCPFSPRQWNATVTRYGRMSRDVTPDIAVLMSGVSAHVQGCGMPRARGSARRGVRRRQMSELQEVKRI